ncbi:CENP-A multicopy suppressor 2 [Lecanosticta acicola]|uniref:CENP-A multicopy suppressor 2 n=1 Tax=Lecanosticta acicola TaxID=111012 RepID=A0AAI9E3Q3_9PEZI|nr:CENP-A multicopy suppressor 2 [Lecanosticta acicola]
MEVDDGSSFGDLPTRPMRVKVLYTFDAEGKTTCLARFPDTLNIPVVALDEQSQVGVIDLQQCIQAIVAASPEIISKLDNGDFTVYNYDYTEYDTPIVGQGRLSGLMGTLAAHNKAMITGRVCKNIAALFSGGVKETLEVKFKLTPLSKPTQNDFVKNADAFRSLSPATSAGFDPNAWSASMQQHRTQHQSNDYLNFEALAAGGDNGAAMLENMFGMGSGSSVNISGHQQPGGEGVAETPNDSAFAYNPAFSAHPHSAPGSRTGSPIMRPASNIPSEQSRHQSFSGYAHNFPDQSRPGSRASVRSESNAPTYHHQAPSQDYRQQSSQPQSEVFYNEDGQSRKRAKVTQTDWRGKSSFGAKSADLRVTAATASSMHMHRPIAKRPSAPGADLEPPPRVPTPVPQRTLLPHQYKQQSAGPRSALRQSTVESDFMSDIEPMSDAMTSPEGSSPGNSITGETPMDIPSSPPLIPGYNQPTPSSPGLPTLPPSRLADSGYMSGTVMESMEEDMNRSPDAEDLEMARQYRSRSHPQQPFVKTEGSIAADTLYLANVPPSELNVQLEEPGDMGRLPQKSIINLPPGRRDGSQGPKNKKSVSAHQNAASAADSEKPRPDADASRRGSLALPSKPLLRAQSQEQGFKPPPKQKRQPLQRSHTANDSEAGSPAPSDTESRPRAPPRSGSGAPRRKLIEQRLKSAIARGEMPVYCSHCGAIETPTWRKIYVKEVSGKPSPLDAAEGEGETIGIENLTTDDDSGEVTSFLIRKSMKKTKDNDIGEGFNDLTVCNPCGLWFNKFRNMRPEDKWHRKCAPRKKKSKTGEGFSTDGVEPQSEAFFTDQPGPEEANESGKSGDKRQTGAGAAPGDLPRAPVQRPRANSMQPQLNTRRSSSNSNAGPSMREVQSSPIRLNGSQDEPIELDMTPHPKPTRRLLFPSPRRPGETKSLEGSPAPRTATPPAAARVDRTVLKTVTTDMEVNVNVFEAFTFDKENLAPPLDENYDLAHLFDGSPSVLFRTPLKKTPLKSTPRSQRQTNDLLKTPTPSSRKRKALSPSQNAANGAQSNPNDFMTSPSGRYFLRSTPSRLDRTPGGRSASGGQVEPSPFSRHLAQMLSEANGIDVVMTSPSRQYDFSDLPTFTTPGREVDWKGLDEILSSEFANYDENGFDTAQPGEPQQQE